MEYFSNAASGDALWLSSVSQSTCQRPPPEQVRAPAQNVCKRDAGHAFILYMAFHNTASKQRKFVLLFY